MNRAQRRAFLRSPEGRDWLLRAHIERLTDEAAELQRAHGFDDVLTNEALRLALDNDLSLEKAFAAVAQFGGQS